ncbi:hypothetical protein PR003_g32827 [Phytophthora rubi]|uniref:Uncharacterized protein n=1 Tax=Phytophthora rubi TaxID=129364 RepID=A0A6A3GWJ2_9STRA|nr:hypothetical protein PR001_g30061 [Phytophthora rubi]KAE9264362.1 hypothetical protein PR003_g32827 [Phytophthora rubi]
MSSPSVDTPAPSSPTVAATDPATGVYTSAPVAPAGSPTPSTVEAAANASALALTACSDGGLPSARRGARAARPQAELLPSSTLSVALAGPAACAPMTRAPSDAPSDAASDAPSGGAPSGSPSVSSIHVALPSLDRDALRASISPSDAPSGAPSVSSIHVALPPLDRDSVRASISHLTGILDHVTALADLENDHDDLHFPRAGEKRAWYPVLGCNPAPADLILALRAIDSAEPWCNPFHGHQAAHPSAQVARLANKFVPAGVL